MTMKDDDYLWDPKATPDPEIERLEQMLGQLRGKTTAPLAPTRIVGAELAPPGPTKVGTYTENVRADLEFNGVGADPRVRPYVGLRFLGPALAAAATIALMIGGLTRQPDVAMGFSPASTWPVSVVVGTPRVG